MSDDHDYRENPNEPNPARLGQQGAGCCSERRQASCCEPGEKADCCGASNEATLSGSCGCQ